MYNTTLTAAGGITADDYIIGETVTWTGGSGVAIYKDGNTLWIQKVGAAAPTGTLTGGTSGTALALGTLDSTRVLGDGVVSDTVLILTASWSGPTVSIPRPPAILWCENDFGSITEFSARGAALFQQRLWFINTYSKSLFDSSIELRPLRMIASSLYDPFVLIGNIGAGGQLNEASPIDADLRIGQDQELMWIVGGDSLMIGGKTQEYALANDRQGIGASSLPQFRVCSYYGSEPGTAVAEFDGNIVFTPEGGGDLISMAYTDSGNKYQAKPLNPFSRDITGDTVAFAAAPASQGRPARMVAVQSDGSAVAGYFNSKYAIPGWVPITLPGNTTAVDAVRFGGDIYLVLRRTTNAHTLCKLTDWTYALDLYEEAATAGTPGQDSDSWTVDDFEKRSNTLFAVGLQTFYTMKMSASTADYEIGEVVSRSTWNGIVYGKWSVGSDHYLLVSEATGAPTATWTITGADSGEALTLTSYTTSTETKALEFVDLNGTGEFETSVKLTRCWVGFPVIPTMEPLNLDGQDELGPSRGRKRRVMSARVRYKDTSQMYVDGVPVVEGAMTAATTELPARSGVFRKTFLGGWRETDVFQITGAVPYNMYVQDITYEVVT